LRTGKPAFEHLYGKDQWRYFAEDDPEAGALFNQAMTSMSGSMNLLVSLSDAFCQPDPLVRS
jgi:hypothetical protein